MKCSIYTVLTLFALLAGVQGGHAQHHDRNWMGVFFLDTLYQPVIMGFENDSIGYEVRQPTSDIIDLLESVAMSDASGNLQFYTNGNVVVSWDGYIMEGGKGFNEGAIDGNNIFNYGYVPHTYQLIPDGYEEGVYYMLHSFISDEDLEPCDVPSVSSRMQLSKIDMRLNGGKGKVVYKNRYINEVLMGAAFAVVQHGNGHDWWLVQRSPDGMDFLSSLLQRDSVLLTVESSMTGLSSDWYDCSDFWNSALNLLDVSPDGSMLLDNFGLGYAKLMGFDRCSGEVSLMDTFSLGSTYLEYNGGEGYATVYGFAFSPSGRYLYGVGWAGFVQYDLWASDILASRMPLGGVPWALDDFQNLWPDGGVGGFGPFTLGPDGKLYNFGWTAHNLIEYPDEPGEASGYCIAAENLPSCLGPNVPYYLFSTPHPNYRLGPLTGSGCDTILSSVSSPVSDGGYGVTASPTVASGQVEVAITLPSYGNHVAAELQVVDMLGRVMEWHRFPPYAYLHSLEVSDWPAGIYSIVLLEKDRPKASARLVVAR
ncbi:MAG: hypothetical protein K9J37_13325 [Saprospiraceae bacterium]|nr:hypothetical protein [Saprospiraceae bacterium]MCF8250890.1 hypothetical protein [Saprospiraceae bacterium]MCF8281146.1 hypothetical protein [Bacteroidales bacterium]MCF8312709.1 hypothetical protein [Saprospiraceae bacterium]MCF8441156.1 hypothetical protein [Saprospiraceae bacterium]